MIDLRPHFCQTEYTFFHPDELSPDDDDDAVDEGAAALLTVVSNRDWFILYEPVKLDVKPYWIIHDWECKKEKSQNRILLVQLFEIYKLTYTWQTS